MLFKFRLTMDACSERNSNRWRIGIADFLFVFFTCAIMQSATMRMMDDPGLGWHLRYADQMVEQGGFVYEEAFCYPTLNNKVVMRAWLSDLILRAAYDWGGLNAIAVLICLVLAVTLRCIYCRLAQEGAHWSLAALASYLAAMGLSPSYVARPNAVSFLGVWLVADLCQRFHVGRASQKQLWLLVPIMLLWTNMHGGFLAGIVLIAIAWSVEAFLWVGASEPADQQAAQARLHCLTKVGFIAGLATLVNPNGIGLHLWSFAAVTDPFIQTKTTTEWLPPDFGAAGMFNIERLLLLLPLLAATCRSRLNWVGLAMSIVWIHFAITSRRYSTIWVVIMIPTLCEMTMKNPWLIRMMNHLGQWFSEDVQKSVWRQTAVRPPAQLASWIFAIGAFVITPWLPTLAAHNPEHLPATSLDRFLELNAGEPTFHCINWGGYLTWHGWDKPTRFQTWIDDRTDVHGAEHMKKYYRVMNAEPGWQSLLEETNVEMFCIPPKTRLAYELSRAPALWDELFSDDFVRVFRRRSNSVAQQ